MHNSNASSLFIGSGLRLVHTNLIAFHTTLNAYLDAVMTIIGHDLKSRDVW